MALKIINGILILFAAYMGIKQGWAMLSGKNEMLEMFGKWNIGKQGVMVIGFVTILSVVLMLLPKTFVWGNFLMAAGILLIICFHLLDKDFKGVLIELPFFLLSLVIIYLQHPLAKAS
jgi:DoxX-like family